MPEPAPPSVVGDTVTDPVGAADVDATDDEDIDHFTCCDPAYYLATDRPVYMICGRRLRPDERIKLDVDETPLCEACVEIASRFETPEEFCRQLCPRLVFG